MAETPQGAEPARRFDPLTAIAVVFFLMAVAFAAAPAINAGPATLAGLMLLVGLAGVACLGLFVLRSTLETPTDAEPGAERLVEALAEPAALAAAPAAPAAPAAAATAAQLNAVSAGLWPGASRRARSPLLAVIPFVSWRPSREDAICSDYRLKP